MIPCRNTGSIQINNGYVNIRVFLRNHRHGGSSYISGSYTRDVFYWFHFYLLICEFADLLICLSANLPICESAYLRICVSANKPFILFYLSLFRPLLS